MSVNINKRLYKCNIEHCKKVSTDSDIILHRLPVDPTLYQIWLDKCKIKIPHPVHFFVCSDHFKKDDYIPTRNWERRRLKKYSIPSIFPVARKIVPTADVLENMRILKSFSVNSSSRSNRKRKYKSSSPPAVGNMIVNLNEVYLREEDMLREVDESDVLGTNNNESGS